MRNFTKRRYLKKKIHQIKAAVEAEEMILAYKHWNFWKIQKKDRKMDRAHPILNEKDFSIFTKSVCEAKIAKKNQHDWETKTANYRMNQAI